MEMAVWSEIREEGFGGKKLKTRDVKRLWRRRHTIAQDVERLELGCAGGVFKTNKRQSGAMRRACLGCGQRGMVEVMKCAKGGEEGGQEAGGAAKGQKVVRKGRKSALIHIFDEIQMTFEGWRMGGQYVDAEDVYKPAVSLNAMPTLGEAPVNLFIL